MKAEITKYKVKRKVPGFMGGFYWEFGYVYVGRYDWAEFAIIATNKGIEYKSKLFCTINDLDFEVVFCSDYQSEMCIQNVLTCILSYHRINKVLL